ATGRGAPPAAAAASMGVVRTARVILGEAGPPLGTDVTGHRPVGRIGGLVGLDDRAACSAIVACLGPGAEILRRQLVEENSSNVPLVADWDVSAIKGEPIRTLDDYRAVITAGTPAPPPAAFS